MWVLREILETKNRSQLKTPMITFYCVWAYRCGDNHGYNFPVGIFFTLRGAKKAAKNHREFRGGKYEHKIYKIPLGKVFDAQELTPVVDTTHHKPSWDNAQSLAKILEEELVDPLSAMGEGPWNSGLTRGLAISCAMMVIQRAKEDYHA
jgi:hypothetical protein